jgi:FixJ family two-component response regulator
MSNQRMNMESHPELNVHEQYTAKILVIDDELSIRKTLTSILQKQHYYVETAENYEVIKDKLFTSKYDALILDIILPDVNGIEILHIINKAEVNLPVIMLTGAPSLETARESVKFGAFDYLVKPVESNLLLNQLKNAVQKKRLVDSRDELMNQLKKKNEELEVLVEKRTEDLKISEIRSRTVIEAVHDMIIITDNVGIISFSNVMFLDAISESSGQDLHFSDIIGKQIDEFIDALKEMKLKSVLDHVSHGSEFDLIELHFKPKLKIKDNYNASIRGIFNEDLELQEIIFIISPK